MNRRRGRLGALGASLSALLWVTGCSHTTLSHTSMGPAPTAPPGGSPYAPGTPGAQQLSTQAQQAFVDKLAAAPRDQRPALIRANSTTMTAIQAGPDSPIKQKLQDILNQR